MNTYHEHRAWCRRWEARRGLYCWLYTWKLYWARRVWFASAANYSRSLFRSRLSSSCWTLKQARSNVCSDMRFYIEFLQGTTRGWLFGNDFELNLSMMMSVGVEFDERGFVILSKRCQMCFCYWWIKEKLFFSFLFDLYNCSQIDQDYLQFFETKFQIFLKVKKLEKLFGKKTRKDLCNTLRRNVSCIRLFQFWLSVLISVHISGGITWSRIKISLQ